MAIKYYQVQNFLSREVFCGKLLVIKFLKKIPVFVYRFFYNLSWWPARMIFSFFLHFEVETKENLEKLKGPLIIVANHSCWIDPFLIGTAFPFRSQVFPIRYLCWYKHFYKLRNYLFVHLYGSFPIRKKMGLEKSLEIPLQILKDKGVVGIFPEGKRVKRGRYPKGRRGAAFLALKTRTKILPVKIEGNRNMKPWKFFLRSYKVKIKIGKSFYLVPQKITKLEDLNQPTNFLMQKIREL